MIAILAGPGIATADAAGFIAGSVAAEGSPIGGIEVCVEGIAGTPSQETFRCVESELDGEWTSPELPSGSYHVIFWPGQMNYVAQYWEDTTSYASAKLVTVTTGTVPGIDAELVEGATISGTVTAAATGRPVAEVEVCASIQGEAPERCGLTDFNGHYTIHGLFAGSWEVAFYPYESGQDLVYQRDPTPVPVATKANVQNVNAALVAGGQIAGTARLAATGAPLAGVRVCLVYGPFVYTYGCLKTPASGAYRFTGLEEGPYKVVFSPETSELLGPEAGPSEAARLAEAPDAYPTQWWNGKPSFATADSITVTPPAVITGIDGSLGPPPVAVVAPAPVTPAPIAAKPKTKPVLICHKGFAKRKVKGKQRCVKLHKKRHRRHKKHHRH